MEEIKFYDYLVKVESIAKIGRVFSTDKYALDNYKEIEEITTAAIKEFTNMNFDRPNYFSREIYPTPSISCRGILVNDNNELLLVQEEVDGKYSLPGGWCDLYDSPKEATAREFLEEAGMEVEVQDLVALINRTPLKGAGSVPEYAMYFRCSLKVNHHVHDHEILNVGFFPLNDLPELSCKVTRDEFDRVINALLNRKQEID